MTEDQAWISTHKANAILAMDITDATFREKFRKCLPWRFTPGKHYRWLRAAVEELARTVPQAG